LYEKAAGKILVKLTPGGSIDHVAIVIRLFMTVNYDYDYDYDHKLDIRDIQRTKHPSKCYGMPWNAMECHGMPWNASKCQILTRRFNSNKC
jgi:hypothetical protein